MAKIEWTDELDTGIAEIDSQHRQLVDYLNDLHQAILDGKQDAVALVIEELVDYTQIHFIYEEKLLQDANYEFFQAHQRVHELFTARVIRYKRRFEEGEDIATELFELLRRWLINHISHDDKNFAPIVLAAKEDERVQQKTGLSGVISRFRHRFRKHFSDT